MTTYAGTVGWNLAGSIEDLVYQPYTFGHTPGRVEQGGDQLFYEDGFEQTALRYKFMTNATYYALLGQMGLRNARSSKMTLRLRTNNQRAFEIKNVIITRPSGGRNESGIWLDLDFPVIIKGDAT